ncbi:hypothetical protein PHYBLDRAFT_67244 [Phycomyces blakesleeanus NRRL 1555(-)]|uniref:DDE Tnp4 domain-containing protein n=1 Tax=Phycomyces blakesleeanus (strain ATCC 8743b / DSM 1359 / FGSC 10004 / NBRC 33097 / NRRL 1555) TaxID=763407 RepID=A0A167K280_PHYB8|nr:hypothetical protein PHYBLDRAFT_67244 [Phycomyces blakesleeanus NRRL 1555(-)]OAD67108.1 hypothetical protein PHYBLDRAFT_67244 [Phycomyces blakesleeanus NRRL 1555(-)]|eukprot:XP_018285148.1 hypothetical protein PHYBLDRAFT_67244 [Phycomyces blakesleeanus NRRL 1555(-)]
MSNNTNINSCIDSSNSVYNDSDDENETSAEHELATMQKIFYVTFQRNSNFDLDKYNCLELELGSPVHLVEQSGIRNNLNGGTNHWWTYCHPYLHDGTGPNSFWAHYRVNRETFNVIVNVLRRDPEYQASEERSEVSHPVWKQIAVALWYLSNTHFGYRIALELLTPATLEESQKIMDGFAVFSVRSEHQHLNECIGAVDKKLIVIQKPSLFGNSWLDRHSNASMALMAVCDHKKRFIDIRVGLARSQNNTFIFKTSNLYQNIIHSPRELFCDPRSYIVGDSAFPILKHCLIPYYRVNDMTPESMAKVITTCCILHNMCITFGDSKEYLKELLRAGEANLQRNMTIMDWFVRADNTDGASFEAHDADNDDEDFEDLYAEIDNSHTETETASEGRARRDQVKDTL